MVVVLLTMYLFRPFWLWYFSSLNLSVLYRSTEWTRQLDEVLILNTTSGWRTSLSSSKCLVPRECLPFVRHRARQVLAALLIKGPCVETRPPEVSFLLLLTIRVIQPGGHRAKWKGLNYCRVLFFFLRKLSFIQNPMVTCLRSSISTSSHLGEKSAICLGDERGGMR